MPERVSVVLLQRRLPPPHRGRGERLLPHPWRHRPQEAGVHPRVVSSSNDVGEIRVTQVFLVDDSPDDILKAVDEAVRDLGVDT